MRSIVLAIFIVLLPGFAYVQANAQGSKTVILVRHAEKDTSDAADQNDPGLSPAGVERARRLLKTIRRYHPGAVYSTNFKRTRETVAPIASRRRLEVQSYDAKQPQALVDAVMNSKTKRFVIAGHSNTIPGLANLFIRKEIFKQLDDNEYGTIWIIRLKPGKQPKVEVLGY